MTLAVPTWLRELPVAHRGLYDSTIADNSLDAFAAALMAGYAIELDVQASRDGVPIVGHSYRARDVAGRPHLIGCCRSADLARMTDSVTGGRLATLADALDLVQGQVPVYVDLKPQLGARRLASAVADALNSYKGPAAVLSFDPRLVRWFRHRAPDVIRGQSAGQYHSRLLPAVLQTPVTAMPANDLTRPQFVAYDLHALPSRAFEFWRRRLQYEVIFWGVKSDDDVSRARALGGNIMFDEIRPPLAST